MVNNSERPKSLILTGAPTTGKSTLAHHLVESGNNFRMGLDYTTRSPRVLERNGIDRHFISKDDFKQMFDDHQFLEPNLEFALYNGEYYGTPVAWKSQITCGENLVMVTVSTEIANILKCVLGELAIWAHLTAPVDVRAQRLKDRGLSKAEISYRLDLSTGDSQNTPDNVDLALNTATLDQYISLSILMQALCQKKILIERNHLKFDVDVNKILSPRIEKLEDDRDINFYFILSYPRSDMGKGSVASSLCKLLGDAKIIKFDGLLNTNKDNRHLTTERDDFEIYERENPHLSFSKTNHMLLGDLLVDFIDRYGE